MKKRAKVTKEQRVAEEKAALRRRLEDLLLGAHGDYILPNYEEEDEFAGIPGEFGIDTFGRWLGGIKSALLSEANASMIGPRFLDNFEYLSKATDFLYERGIRA